jgi:L-alanine-DL-glutamate epimerase-like enolase superfamily enzyme
MQVEFRKVNWPFASLFRIAYRTQAYAETIQVELRDGSFVGRGEGLGVSYRGETVDSMLAQLAQAEADLVGGISRMDLQALLPPGGARNAVDCALWDLEAKRSGHRAWELAGMTSVKPIVTDYTLSLDSPDSMARAAAAARAFPALKLKLAGVDDVERVAAVRAVRPDAEIIVDANQAWSEQQLHEFAPQLAKLGVRLIEQPLPAGADDALVGFNSPVPLCADESCQTRLSLPSLAGKYQFINIKLDKTGGLTEALALAHEALARNFKLMVGCMAGSSLSMAPAFIIGQLCSAVDLDGPLLAAADVPNAIRYHNGQMQPPERALWG